jgi:hypothetical protein
MEPKDAVQWAGAATEARAQDMPLAPPAKNTAAEIAITATTLLGVSAATKVNTAIATRPMMIGSLRELIGENPPAISLSVTQPTAQQNCKRYRDKNFSGEVENGDYHSRDQNGHHPEDARR